MGVPTGEWSIDDDFTLVPKPRNGGREVKRKLLGCRRLEGDFVWAIHDFHGHIVANSCDFRSKRPVGCGGKPHFSLEALNASRRGDTFKEVGFCRFWRYRIVSRRLLINEDLVAIRTGHADTIEMALLTESLNGSFGARRAKIGK